MAEILLQEIKSIINIPAIATTAVREGFLKRMEKGDPTRDERKESHFCVYFLPYNAKANKVFIVRHKKSGLWLSPGGHIDKGAILHQTLEREMREELGVEYHTPSNTQPFLLTITPIENAVQSCKVHYDVWYGIPTDGSDFNIDPKEFHETRWLTIPEARILVTDPPNLQALEKIKGLMKRSQA